MTTPTFRHEDMLASMGLVRGDAGDVQAYAEKLRLRSGAEIEFEPRGVTAIAGANNSGKSTLLRELGYRLNYPDQFDENSLIAEVIPETSGSYNDFLDWLCRNATLTYDQMSGQHGFRRMQNFLPLANFQHWSTPNTGHLVFQHAAPFFVRQMEAAERNVAPVSRKPNVLDAPTDPLHHLAESWELMQELNRLTKRILGKVLSLDDLNSQIQLRVGDPDRPYPGHYDDPSEYQIAVDKLPTLASQGDGMRSLLGILIPLVTATYPVFIIDEPEAFLHPPQAFALGQELGRISNERGVQVIVATHDRNLLAGLLNSSSPLSVVRLVRDEDKTAAYQLRSRDLKAVWDDPVLKYSNVLDGLFHELVVLAENERDCRFYEAALDARTSPADEDRPLVSTDVLFLPTSGTGGMPKVASALRALKVPVLASPDLDVLDNEAVLKNIVTALDGSWEGMHEDWRIVAEPINNAGLPELVSGVYQKLRSVMETILNEDPMALYDTANRRQIKETLGVTLRPWDKVKHFGVEGLMQGSSNPEAVLRLIEGLAAQGVVVVHKGELESFGHGLGVPKGKNWLPAALEKGLQASDEVQEHISRLLQAAEMRMEPRRL